MHLPDGMASTAFANRALAQQLWFTLTVNFDVCI